MAPKAVDARKRFNRNCRFRGHGPLLQQLAHLYDRWRINRGIYKGSSPCSYDLRPSRRGPPAREAAMGPSYKESRTYPFASRSSSFACTPPNPPLLITRM